MKSTPFPAMSEPALLAAASAGDTRAYGEIVTRYQNLLCSVAYGICGNLATSEDLAQDAFIIGWTRLRDLRDTEKLRSWLCGIVRHLALEHSRKETRRGGPPLELAATSEPAALGPDPAHATVADEEAQMLWRILESLPGSYREPLILFYREQCSVAELACKLDLTEETAKQRLSRGRALLKDEIAAFVESTLARSKPSPRFTHAVLGSLPTLALPAGAAAASGPFAKIVAVLKQALAGANVFAPIAGLLVSAVALHAAESGAPDLHARRRVRRFALASIFGAIAWVAVLLVALSRLDPSAPLPAAALIGSVLLWVLVLVAGMYALGRRIENTIEKEPAATPSIPLSVPWRRESPVRVLGLPLYAIALGGSDATAAGWIAIGGVARSPLLAIGGVAVAPLALGGTAIGVLSIGGIAVGGHALGLLAAGWLAFGGIAVGAEGAAGFAAIAAHHVSGIYAHAWTPLGGDDIAWFATQPTVIAVRWVGHQAHWALVALCVLCALVWWRFPARDAINEKPTRR